MKLFYSQASPFARKVLVFAHEAGLVPRLTLESATPKPSEPTPALTQAGNPLMKIPTLVLDDGTALFDSRVIVEYFDSLAGNKFIPAGAQRWTALKIQAMSDGLLDAAVVTRYEQAIRPQDKQWAPWIDGHLLKVKQALDALERESSLGSGVTIAEIATAAALGYLDFRYASLNWRAGHAKLAAFYEKFAQRPSMTATQPPA